MRTRIRTFYQADPTGVVPGGIDTFIRGLYKWAPDDLEFSLVGMTTDPRMRPVGKWTTCSLGRRDFAFYPVFEETNPGGRSKVPLTVRLSWGVVRHRAHVIDDFDIIELHRMEPMMLFLGDRRPKNAFFHQDMSILRLPNADIRWRGLPGAYFWLEDRLVPRLSSGYCVREGGAKKLQERFPLLADRLKFVPTWVDTELFAPCADPALRHDERLALRRRCGFAEGARIVVTVGRLDTQKNPVLLLEAFDRLAKVRADVVLAFIGDGVLRADLERRVRVLGLEDKVHFFGLLPPGEIAAILRSCDLFALSSAYEGMPMALLEGLGSGLPVVTTDVGEVRRVVTEQSGAVVVQHEPEPFCDALVSVLDGLPRLAGAPCVSAIQPYRPATVLEPVYENYRRLGRIAG